MSCLNAGEGCEPWFGQPMAWVSGDDTCNGGQKGFEVQLDDEDAIRRGLDYNRFSGLQDRKQAKCKPRLTVN